MAIKISKYVIRMMHEQQKNIKDKVLNNKNLEVDSDSQISDSYYSFEEFVSNKELLYLGHYEKGAECTYVTSNNIFVLKLLDIFEKSYKQDDLKSSQFATQSLYKNLIGVPISAYRIDGYPYPYERIVIDEISEYIPNKDNGLNYSFRFQTDDESDFSAFNNLTAIYYFQGKPEAINIYLSYFPIEEQLINLENTIKRFEKEISKPLRTTIEKISHRLSTASLPVFQALFLEKKMQNDISNNNKNITKSKIWKI